jgi:CheY-like chemotaxis protein
VNVLLVEDDDIKGRHILEHISTSFRDSRVEVVKSVNEAMRAIWTGSYSLVVLDMSLPTFSIEPDYETGGRPQGFGGHEILRFMKRKRVTTPSIVITQFEQFGSGTEAVNLDRLAEMLRSDHPEIFVGLVYYHPSTSQWKAQLASFMTSVLAEKGHSE